VDSRSHARQRPLTPETPLSARERGFVAEYLEHFNATRAAEAVGYGSRTANAGPRGKAAS
jgi:Terminase small subunit